MIGKRLLHYDIVRELGSGGMGVAYEARDTRLKRPVAIKILREVGDAEGGRRRLLREARAAAALHHPNICTIYAVEETDQAAFIAMEYVAGRTLDAVIREGPLEPARVRRVAVQLAEALEAAHRGGVIHGDIKPSNVMLARSGSVKILDFGIARLVRDTTADSTKGSAGPSGAHESAPGGTLPYMSPEQLHQETLDRRTDLFSLGVILYELAAGRHPFRASTDVATMARILTIEPEPLSAVVPGFPWQLERIITRLLRKSRDERYPDAGAVLADLHDVASRRARADRISVAVLPFRNMSGDPRDEYFSHGLASELTSRLARRREFLVISHSSAMRHKSSDRDLRDIGRELGVELIVEGGVRRRGSRCTLNVDLVSVRDGFQLWADSFQVPLDGIFDAQDAISRSIAQALDVTPTQPGPGVPTTDMRAFEAFLRATHAYHKFTDADNRVAIELLERALALDPGYAEAHALLANTYLARVERGWEKDAGTWLGRAARASDLAVDIDPSISRAHSALAAVQLVQRDATRAERHVREALGHDPNNDIAHNLLGRIEFTRGAFRDAIDAYREALRINPYSVWCLNDLAWAQWITGDEPGAHETLDRVLAISPGDEAAHSGKGGLHLLQGHLHEALEHVRRAQAVNPRYPFVLMLLPPILLRMGHLDEARRVCEATLETDADSFLGSAGLGLVEAAAGNDARATEAVSRALDLDPYFPALSLNYAVLYHAAGEIAWAERWVEKAVRDGIDAGHAHAWHPTLRGLLRGPIVHSLQGGAP